MARKPPIRVTDPSRRRHRHHLHDDAVAAASAGRGASVALGERHARGGGLPSTLVTRPRTVTVGPWSYSRRETSKMAVERAARKLSVHLGRSLICPKGRRGMCTCMRAQKLVTTRAPRAYMQTEADRDGSEAALPPPITLLFGSAPSEAAG